MTLRDFLTDKCSLDNIKYIVSWVLDHPEYPGNQIESDVPGYVSGVRGDMINWLITTAKTNRPMNILIMLAASKLNLHTPLLRGSTEKVLVYDMLSYRYGHFEAMYTRAFGKTLPPWYIKQQSSHRGLLVRKEAKCQSLGEFYKRALRAMQEVDPNHSQTRLYTQFWRYLRNSGEVDGWYDRI